MQITPFTVAVPQADVDDLVARIANTRWPSDVVDELEPWRSGLVRPEARRLLGQRVRLVGPAGIPELVPAVHDLGRRPDDPLRPRPLVRGRRHTSPPAPRLPELVRRVQPDDRPARRPGSERRSRRGGVPRGHPVDARLRLLHAAELSGLGHPADRRGLRPDHDRARLRALRRSRRRRRRRPGRAALHPGRRPGHRVAGRHRSGRDRDRVHAADRPPDRRGTGPTPRDEGRPSRGFRLSPGPDDAPAVDRLRPDRFARHAADLDRREGQGVDRPGEGAAGGRGGPRPAAHTRQRLLVRPGRCRCRELPLRGRSRRRRVGPGPRSAAGLRLLRSRAARPPDPGSGGEACLLERASGRRPLPGDGNAGPPRRGSSRRSSATTAEAG